MHQTNLNSKIKVCEANDMAPACISAIFGNSNILNSLRPTLPLGENIFINKNYTDFRPLRPEMNLLNSRFTGFKSRSDMNGSEINRRHQIHYQYKENRYDFDTDMNSYKIIDDELVCIEAIQEKTDLERVQFAAQLSSEYRIYTKKTFTNNTLPEKRGLITNVSPKSANRLKKFLASIEDLGLWIDFTFPDDVMKGKTLAERKDFANECLKKLKRFIHSLGLKEIWKKEFTTRKSGKLKDLYVPHYHVAIAGLSRKQNKTWPMLCIKILCKWVDIMG